MTDEARAAFLSAAPLLFRMMAAGGAWARAQILAERSRWALWIPPGLGFGAGVYFMLGQEPPAYGGIIILTAALLLAWAGRRHSLVLLSGIILAVLASGFTAGQIRTALVGGPILLHHGKTVTVTGRVLVVESPESGVRVVLAQPVIDGLAPEETPRRVRITLADHDAPPWPGTIVTLPATLGPPSAPAEPGAFDYRFDAFFKRIGGTGKAQGPATLAADQPPPGLWTGLAVRLESARRVIIAHVLQHLSGAPAGIAIALLTGKRSDIPEVVLDNIRTSGLAHILAIAGLHVGLVAGIIFFTARAVLAAIEPLALHYPIKKWAALAALLGAVAYMLMVGAVVSAERAALMTGIGLAAVMLDRVTLGMRTIAFAAAVLLLAEPESVFGASFQLSFGVVAGLIATYEVMQPRLAKWWRGDGVPLGRIGRLAHHVGTMGLTSLVASLASAPYTLYHFQQVSTYGVIANAIAIPLMALWVMPCGLLTYAAIPLGLETWPLTAMGWGMQSIAATAGWVAGLPGAQFHMGAISPLGLFIITAGYLWLLIWQRPWRLAGLAAIALGFAVGLAAPQPDILIAEDGGLMAVRLNDGRLSLSSNTHSRFIAETWERRDDYPLADPWPPAGASADGSLSCDALACLYKRNGQTVSLLRKRDAAAEDCASAAMVISANPLHGCHGPVTIDRFDLWKHGAQAVFLSPTGIAVVGTRAEPLARPWTGH